MKSATGTLILDNGVVLGELFNGWPKVVPLLNVAEKVHPTIIVCPDVLKDDIATKRMLLKYGQDCRSSSHQMMIVPQSESVQAWPSAAVEMIELARSKHKPTVLGVTGVLDRMEPEGRFWALHGLVDKVGLAGLPPIHLLGIRTNLRDIQTVVRRFPVVGVDSSLPFALALRGEAIHMNSPKVSLTSREWRMVVDQLDPFTMNVARNNILIMRRWLKEWSDE